MRTKNLISHFTILMLLAGVLSPWLILQGGAAKPQADASAYELIAAMNTLRMANGLPALIEDPIINAVAQNTADIMAANQMSWHIGNVRGRLAVAGYGGGATIWATENFAAGGSMGIDEIMVAWSDAEHMRPAVTAAYCHVGAGVAKAANGMTYYVLQAAYISGQACGDYAPAPGTTARPGIVPGIIIPVSLSTPDADGKVYHIVQAGQSLWAIAIAYQITIRDLEIWNNIDRATPLKTGQRLFIPGKNTEGYATPTPVGMIIPATPDVEGKIIHVVQPYNALITIADAYHVTINTILALNGLLEEWPLQIGQKLLIYPGDIIPSPTPRPLTPIEKLTPAADGNYYHLVRSGETLSWIASLYEVALADLMAWNGLNANSIIRPDQTLLLKVMPPATATDTPGPPTATPTETLTPLPATRTTTLSVSSPIPTATSAPASSSRGFGLGWIVLAALAAMGGLLWLGIYRKPPAAS